MVKAGYVRPNEVLYQAENDLVSNEEKMTELGMQRATSVFYDYVLNFRQDLLSPQYQQFYEASVETTD